MIPPVRSQEHKSFIPKIDKRSCSVLSEEGAAYSHYKVLCRLVTLY